jgi:quinolinate synthase
LEVADYICSTGAMIDYAKENHANDFIIVTECGMINKLSEDVPNKHFYSFCNFCRYMKLTTLNSVLESIISTKHKIELSEDIIIGARHAIENMIKIS